MKHVISLNELTTGFLCINITLTLCDKGSAKFKTNSVSVHPGMLGCHKTSSFKDEKAPIEPEEI